MENPASRWRQLCQIAFLELGPDKLPERISLAHSAVVERMLEIDPRPSSEEHKALEIALEKLQRLRRRQEPEQVH